MFLCFYISVHGSRICIECTWWLPYASKVLNTLEMVLKGRQKREKKQVWVERKVVHEVLGWKRSCKRKWWGVKGESLLLHLCAATVKDDFPCLPLYCWDGGSSSVIHEPAWKSMQAAQTWNQWLGSKRGEEEEGREELREGGGAKEFTEVCWSGTISSWAGPRGGVEVGPMWEGKQRGEVS